MTDIIRQLEAEQAEKILEKRKLPDFSPGDTVRVHGARYGRQAQPSAGL